MKSVRPGMAVAAALAALLLGCRSSSTPERIVLIVVDTLRADHIGAYGSSTPTPHIDALARRGQVFTNHLASFSQTSMSMAALFTGLTPSVESVDSAHTLPWNELTWCGLSRFPGVNDESTCIPESVPSLASRLRDAGYWTIGINSNQHIFEPSGFGRGFDDWVEVGVQPAPGDALARFRTPGLEASRRWTAVNPAAIEAIDRRPRDRFFLYVHYMEPHDYGPDVARYPLQVQAVDRAIGELLERLDDAGLLEDSVVVLTADHGERLGDPHAVAGNPSHLANPAFQELLRVPLIVAPPTARGDADFIRTQDVFDLVLEIAGVPAEDDDQVLEPDELYLSEQAFRTYVRGRWKTILWRDSGRAMLFDLENDPGELHDVAAEHPDVVRAHRQRIEELARKLSAEGPPAGTAPREPDFPS